jgi:tetratricopeptide (TPR) repeat protein
MDIHLPAFSRILAEKAEELRRKGQPGRAQIYAGLSLEANPGSFKAIVNYMKLRQAGRGSRVGQTLQNLAQALDHFQVSLKAAGQMTIWASLLLMAWGGLCLLYLAAGRAPRILHLFSERLPKQIPARLRTFYSGCLWLGLAIVAASFSLPLAAGALAAAAAAFAGIRERVLLSISVLFILAASVGLSLGHRMMESAGQGYLELLDEANHSPWSRRLDSELRRAQEERPEDLKPIFGMALLAGRAGKQELAAGQYLMLLESRPGNAPALNNLGNVMFRLSKHDSAQALYQNALAADPGLAVAHYNLGQVHFHLLRFPEGKRELEKASEIDPRQISQRSAQGGGGFVLDALMSKQVLWSNALSGWSLMEGFDRLEAGRLGGPGIWLPAAGGLALTVLFILALVLYRGVKPDDSCQTCGEPLCPRCAGEDGRYCPACAEKIFAAQSPDIQEKVARSLKPLGTRRRLIHAVVANAVLPGSSWAVSGKYIAGWLWALMWALVYATWRSWAMGFYPARALSLFGLGAWLLALLAALLYLLSWLGLAVLRQE